MKNIYKTVLLCFLTSASHLSASFSQTAPPIEWQNSIGGSKDDYLKSMEQTADGGYILGGYSRSGISGDKTENSIDNIQQYDYWIVKTDSAGNIQWQNTIGGLKYDNLQSVKQTNDRGYILGGSSNSFIYADKTEKCKGGSDYWIVKTDSMGNIKWQKTIGGKNIDQLTALQQTTDNGYILGGYSISNVSGDKTEPSWNNSLDYWIVKIDSSGTLQWQKTLGGSGEDKLNAIQQTADGGYILGGTSFSAVSGNKTVPNCNGTYLSRDYWIVKTDELGNIQWQKAIGGGFDDYLTGLKQTYDGGYILGGYSSSNIGCEKSEAAIVSGVIALPDYWIVKTDSLGNVLWDNTIGGTLYDFLTSISPTSDHGYIMGGYSMSNISGDKTQNSQNNQGIDTYDYWIVKTDSTGYVLWDKTIGGLRNDFLTCILQTKDGGYMAGGYSNFHAGGDKTEGTNGKNDYWIIKLAPDIPTFRTQHSFNIKISNTPLSAQPQIIFNNTNQEKFLFILYDITGRVCGSISTMGNQIILNKDNKKPGVYLFNLVNEKTRERWNGKIVISN